MSVKAWQQLIYIPTGSQALLSPANIQQSPLPQFNTAFGNFTDSPPFSPSYRHQSHSSGKSYRHLVCVNIFPFAVAKCLALGYDAMLLFVCVQCSSSSC